MLSHGRPRRDDKEPDVVATSFLGLEHIIAQTESIGLRLAAEGKGMQRALSPGREQMNPVAIALGFEELPHGANLYERGGFPLDLLDVVKELQRFGITPG